MAVLSLSQQCHFSFLLTHQDFSMVSFSFSSRPSCSPQTKKLPEQLLVCQEATRVFNYAWGCVVMIVVSYWSSAFSGRLDFKCQSCQDLNIEKIYLKVSMVQLSRDTEFSISTFFSPPWHRSGHFNRTTLSPLLCLDNSQPHHCTFDFQTRSSRRARPEKMTQVTHC